MWRCVLKVDAFCSPISDFHPRQTFALSGRDCLSEVSWVLAFGIQGNQPIVSRPQSHNMTLLLSAFAAGMTGRTDQASTLSRSRNTPSEYRVLTR